jgi:hypothetical protein
VACAVFAFWFLLCKEGGVDPKLVVRTFDLTSAYRQVGLSQTGREFACIRVFDPKDKCMKYFRCSVLPFGAVRSVHTFLRLARAIWWIGTVGCKLMWTSFYDDFITCSKPILSRCAESTVISLFRLLGWAFAEDGDKCQPFSNSCEALGVAVDLSNSCMGRAFIRNTDARIQELCADLQAVLDEDKLNAKVAQRLRGRMQFAESQLFGRTGRRCLKVLGEFAEGRRLRLQCKDKFFINLFKELLQCNVPREVCALGHSNVIVFTDACYERDSLTWPCGLGGVFCEGNERFYFSLEVNEHVRSILGELVKKQIIFEAETLAAVVAFILWKQRFANKRCILFVDNEGTKFSLLKGSSDNSTVDMLAGFFAEHEASVHTITWLARVPSKSNLADHPSRNDVSLPFFKSASNVSDAASIVLEQLVRRMLEGGEDGCVTNHSGKRKKLR